MATPGGATYNFKAQHGYFVRNFMRYAAVALTLAALGILFFSGIDRLVGQPKKLEGSPRPSSMTSATSMTSTTSAPPPTTTSAPPAPTVLASGSSPGESAGGPAQSASPPAPIREPRPWTEILVGFCLPLFVFILVAYFLFGSRGGVGIPSLTLFRTKDSVTAAATAKRADEAARRAEEHAVAKRAEAKEARLRSRTLPRDDPESRTAREHAGDLEREADREWARAAGERAVADEKARVARATQQSGLVPRDVGHWLLLIVGLGVAFVWGGFLGRLQATADLPLLTAILVSAAILLVVLLWWGSAYMDVIFFLIFFCVGFLGGVLLGRYVDSAQPPGEPAASTTTSVSHATPASGSVPTSCDDSCDDSKAGGGSEGVEVNVQVTVVR